MMDKFDVDKSQNELSDQKSFVRQASGNTLMITAEYDSDENIVLRIGAFDLITAA